MLHRPALQCSLGHDTQAGATGDHADQAIETLGAEILRIQAQGDIDAARSLVRKYAVEGASIQADVVSLELEKIPVDIRFNYER